MAPVRESAKMGSSDVQSAHYRSATTSAENPTNEWNVSTTKPHSNQVWCVRGEHDASAVVARESVPAVSVLPTHTRMTHNALRFEVKREEHLVRLQAELEGRIYHPSRSVVAHTKFREIFAADFRDRVGHHAVVEALDGVWGPTFLYDSYAAGKARGPTGRRWRLKRL